MDLKIFLTICLIFQCTSSMTHIEPTIHAYQDQPIEILDVPCIEKTDKDELKACLIESMSSSNTYIGEIVKDASINESVWIYADRSLGYYHLGNDYYSSTDQNIYSPLYGYILKADASYSRSGFIGCTDGKFIKGGGNQIYLLAEYDNRIYGFIFMHCDDVFVAEGDFVRQGQVIATIGDTGESRGHHCHLEMYYLGEGKLTDYIGISFSNDLGVGRDAVAYSNRCSKTKGYPCILDSRDYIGK